MSQTLTSTGPNAETLRQRVDEFVGLFFYGTLLKSAREHPLSKSKVGFGGRGEEAFGAQLDQELAQRAGRARHDPLCEAIVRQLSGRRSVAASHRPAAEPSAPDQAAAANADVDAAKSAWHFARGELERNYQAQRAAAQQGSLLDVSR